MDTIEENKKRMFKFLSVLIIILSAYLAVMILSEIKKTSILGESATPATISFAGHGEVMAVPDIATIYFTISKDDKTVKDAQAGVAVIEKKALDLLKEKGVDSKDIKTADASFYPKYQNKQIMCPQIPMGISASGAATSPSSAYYCPGGEQVVVGYTASESITVKIRNTDTAADIMQGLGAAGVTNLSGPNFTVDKEDDLKAQARKLAIDDAKAKAEVLAKDLGVKLERIVSFNEGANYPIMYAKDAVMNSGASEAPAPAVLPVGQNTISSDVTITYEVR